MSESTSIQPAAVKPEATYLKDYQVPFYLIDEIDLQFDLYEEVAWVSSRMKIRRNRSDNRKNKPLALNHDELILESIKLDGQLLTKSDYILSKQYLTLHNVPDCFTLEIVTKNYPEKNTALSGLYRSSGTYCTQCEAEGFRRITFYLDHPDVLARYSTTITADKKRYPYLLSNGNLVASGEIEQGRHFAKWEDPFKKPSYLFALVAGDFDLLEDQFVTQSGREVALRIYVEKGAGDQAAHAMYAIKEAMRWDEIAFGREYDLDIYMMVAIGDFNMGAMENKGLNIFNTKYVLAKPETATDDDYIHIMSVIAHEYFHNWSGNRVTCRDWFQLSLKEGLTIFRDQSFSEDTLSRAVMRIRDVVDLRETQFPEDAGPLAHPVRPDSYIEINNFYTATIYNKGAEILRMLQTIIGKTPFRKGMDLYFARYDGKAVTIEDFIGTMEDVSGMDLTQFRLWYSQAGTPQLTVEDHYDQDQQTYALTITQHCPKTQGQADKVPLHIPVCVGLLDAKGNEMALHLDQEPVAFEKVLSLTTLRQTFKFTGVPDRPTPSLLRNFSAPVKLNYPYQEADLLFLFKHDSDPFNRWEAGQRLALRVLLKLVQDYQRKQQLTLPDELVQAYDVMLKQDGQDLFLQADMLALPSERYMGEQMEVVDVDAIHQAREFVLENLAKRLRVTLKEVYDRYHDQSGQYQFNMEAVGRRQLKNACLALFAYLPEEAATVIRQFENALTSNMTDTLSALRVLSNMDSVERQWALDMFYETWQHDALVVNKWLSIQAMSRLPFALQQVKSLVASDVFDFKNPNKVYALIATFSQQNLFHFHAADGSGYIFLGEMVQILDALNPQVSARMVKPLTTWNRYDKERQVLMRHQLERMLQDKKISTDLYELLTKSLEGCTA
ncbi:MAG: aminopeptidase N [Gammaproteobacteria bacterium RIFCSPHIGHO2_12_FULL_45_12]|nr:MAG: aminopeptidase N [Gammaproteobacteria bacterium RIFCSPHIGHO2_12_FULL_45_12]